MNPSRAIQPRTVALLAVSGILAAGSWIASLHWRPNAPVPDPGFLALAAERESLRHYTDSERDIWRGKRIELGGRAWTRASLEAIPAKSDPRWRWTWCEPGQAAIECTDAGLHEWPECLALVASLERLPGATLHHLEVRSAGRAQRRFAMMHLGVRFLLADAAPPPSAPSDPRFIPERPSRAAAGIPVETITKENPK